MSLLRKLAGQTAIYGLSSIAGRLLNYVLVPLYLGQFTPDAYGVVTEFYAFAGFFLVLLTYGMETALFRFLNKEPANPRVYSTALGSVVGSTTLFATVFIVLAQPIANAVHYPDNPEYIIWFTLIMALDAITALPFARMRAENKAKTFATIRLTNIAINIGLNVFFIYFCKTAYDSGADNFLAQCYDPDIGVGYIFIANLVASSAMLLMQTPWLGAIFKGIDKQLWRQMFGYAAPLLLVGLAGMVNEMLDRTLLKYLLPGTPEENQYQLGVYGANYKLAMLMSLFTQAYRYAADPFFFDQAGNKDAKQLYGQVTKFFTIVGCGVFLLVTLFLDLFKYFIRTEAYWEGLDVVPILLMANLFLGIYFNMSIWYKLTDRTLLGGVVAGAGALLTIILNVALIPHIGYMGSAWATLVVYVFLSVVSYFLSRQYYPVHYPLGRMGFYIVVALAVYTLFSLLPEMTAGLKYGSRAFALIAFTIMVGFMERHSLRNILKKT